MEVRQVNTLRAKPSNAHTHHPPTRRFKALSEEVPS